MRTWKIMIRPDKDAVLCRYFEENTTAAKCMYNAANFYIRNTMTGIRKSPEERTSHETEVLQTEVVSYTDIYAGATSLCKKKYNQKKHTPGLGSCVNHRYKKETRMKYCILWGKSKYCYISQAKSA